MQTRENTYEDWEAQRKVVIKATKGVRWQLSRGETEVMLIP